MDKIFDKQVVIVIGVLCGIGCLIVFEFVCLGVMVIGMVMSELGVIVIIVVFVEVGVMGCGVVLNVNDVVVVEVLIDVIVKEFGVLNVFVNNVGIMQDQFVMWMKDEDWDVVIDINLKLVFCLLCVVLCLMMKVCGGCIINIMLVVGLVGNLGQVNYVVVKVGVVGMMCVFVCEIGSCGIMVNCVVLGFIDIDMMKMLLEEQQVVFKIQILFGCFGSLEDIVYVVVFFVLLQVGYIIGMMLYVNGGMYML